MFFREMYFTGSIKGAGFLMSQWRDLYIIPVSGCRIMTTITDFLSIVIITDITTIEEEGMEAVGIED